MDEEYYNMKANPIKHSDEPLLIRTNGQRVWCCPHCMDKAKKLEAENKSLFKWKEWKCKKCGGLNLQGINNICIHCLDDPQKKFRENLGKDLEETRRLIDD